MTAHRTLLALALAGLLTGCTGSGDAGPPGAEGQQGGAGVEETGEALATQTVEVADGDTVEVSVVGLQVEGEVVQLRLTLTPDFASQPEDDEVTLFGALDDTTFRPTLVDAGNLKEYAVLRSDRATLWASQDLGAKATNGSPISAYAWFAAPQDDIDSIDVRVTDSWPAFTDVPISR